MESNTNREEKEINASPRTSQNESDIDDFSTVNTEEEVRETDSDFARLWSEWRSRAACDFRGYFPPRMAVECDLLGTWETNSSMDTPQNFQSYFDPSDFPENECNTDTFVPQLDFLEESEENSANTSPFVLSYSYGFRDTTVIENELTENIEKILKSESPTSSQSVRNEVSVSDASTDEWSSDSRNTSANRSKTSSEEVFSDIDSTYKCNVLDHEYFEYLWNKYNMLKLKAQCTEESPLSHQISKQSNEYNEYSKEESVPTTEEEVEDLLRKLNLTCTDVNDLPGNRPDSPVPSSETDSSDDDDEFDESGSNNTLLDELNSLSLQPYSDVSESFDKASECEWAMDFVASSDTSNTGENSSENLNHPTEE